jgi:iron complex transport system ATP-binding protein
MAQRVLEYGFRLHRMPPDRLPAAVHAAVQHALQQVGLREFAERPTSSLSGGQKQRVAIAGALAECPRVSGPLSGSVWVWN